MRAYNGTINTPCRIVIEHISEDEMVDLHEWLSSSLVAMGLSNAVLDEAIAAALSGVLPIIERERTTVVNRHETLRLVQ